MVNYGRYASIVAAILSAIWFGKTFEIEALIALITFLAGIIGSEALSKREIARRSGDKKVFLYLNSVIPFDYCIEYLKNHFDAEVQYRQEDIKFLKEFRQVNQNPNNHFVDTELDMTRKELVRTIDEFLTVLNSQSFPLDGRPEWSRVFHGSPELYKEINRKADIVIKWHGYFVHEGKKRGFVE